MSTVDSCAPRAVRSNQLSTLRPREHAPANLAAAATMESCAMTLRGCPSLGTRSPVQASVPGELSAAVPQRRVLMRPTLAWDQWQRPGCRRHHRGVVRSPWDTRTRWLFYYVKEVVTSIVFSVRCKSERRVSPRWPGSRGLFFLRRCALGKPKRTLRWRAVMLLADTCAEFSGGTARSKSRF